MFLCFETDQLTTSRIIEICEGLKTKKLKRLQRKSPQPIEKKKRGRKQYDKPNTPRNLRKRDK